MFVAGGCVEYGSAEVPAALDVFGCDLSIPNNMPVVISALWHGSIYFCRWYLILMTLLDLASSCKLVPTEDEK